MPHTLTTIGQEHIECGAIAEFFKKKKYADLLLALFKVRYFTGSFGNFHVESGWVLTTVRWPHGRFFFSRKSQSRKHSATNKNDKDTVLRTWNCQQITELRIVDIF